MSGENTDNNAPELSNEVLEWECFAEMSDFHVRAALADMENVRTWCKDQIK